MTKLTYLSVIRFPTEKAHGLQIMQNCEAFVRVGYDVQFWVSARLNTPQMNAIADPYQHYGVDECFDIKRIPCLDLYWLTFGNLFLQKITFMIATISTLFFMLLRLLFDRADIYYSRDEYVLLALSLFIPKEKLAFEMHLFWTGRLSRWIQRRVVQRVGHIIAITPKLAEDIIQQHGAQAERVIVAHDGIRVERFANPPSQIEARHKIGWRDNDFIVGFVGRLHMLNMDKGVSTLVDALAKVDDISLGLVGGPVNAVQQLREQWLAHDLDEKKFLYAGQVKPDDVPLYLSAFDICAMPHPYTAQYAYYTSPLKLFEYMASNRPIVASDLPGWADVIQHEETALLFPAGDVDTLAEAIRRLKNNAPLRERLAQNAYRRVMAHYTWAARAQHIRQHLERKAANDANFAAQ